MGNGKPIYKRVWFWIIIIVIIAAIASSKGGNSKQTNSQPDKTSYNVNETYEDKDIRLTMTSVENNFTNYRKYAEVKEGCNILKTEFELENVSSSDKSALYTSFKCYADGYACDEFYSVDDAGLTGAFNTTLSSGKKTKGNVYFQVPKNAEKVTIEYSINLFSSEKVIFNVK